MTPSNYRGSLSPSLFLVVVVVAIFLVVVVVVTSRGNSTAIFRNIPSPDATRRDELLLSLRSHKATPWFHENAPTFVPSLSVSTLTHVLRNKSVVSFLLFSLFFPPFRVRSTSLSLRADVFWQRHGFRNLQKSGQPWRTHGSAGVHLYLTVGALTSIVNSGRKI